MNHLFTEISSAFVAAIKRASADTTSVLSDMYVCVDSNITIYDDLESVLFEAALPTTIDGVDRAALLKEVLAQESIKEALEALNHTTPFSVIWVDSDMVQLEELLILDDEVLYLDDDFFTKADQELDLFFEELMKDI